MKSMPSIMAEKAVVGQRYKVTHEQGYFVGVLCRKVVAEEGVGLVFDTGVIAVTEEYPVCLTPVSI